MVCKSWADPDGCFQNGKGNQWCHTKVSTSEINSYDRSMAKIQRGKFDTKLNQITVGPSFD